MQQLNEIIRDMELGLIRWYPFKTTDCILLIGTMESPFARFFSEKLNQNKIADFHVLDLDIESWESVTEKFDIILSVKDLETQRNPQEFLNHLKERLKPHGKLLLGLNNRLGIRYFCGDSDPYTNRNFDGIEDYKGYLNTVADRMDGRMYDRAQIARMLRQAGVASTQYYSVFPNLEKPAIIYSENYLPEEELDVRMFPEYNNPDTIFLDEKNLYETLKTNKLFHKMANAYLVECCFSDERFENDVLQVTISSDRDKENALITVIYRDRVEKISIYPEGKARLYQLIENEAYLKQRNINMIHAELVDGVYRMPYVKYENAMSYLRNTALQDKDKFIHEMNQFRTCILQSSERVCMELEGHAEEVLKKGFIDMVPLNAFVSDGRFVFYDQEFCVENCPVGVMLVRLIDLVYQGNSAIEKILPRNYFLEAYGIRENVERYRRIANEFLAKLRRENELILYYNKVRATAETIHTNRQRMNYSEREYRRLFEDALADIGERKLILFGAGKFAKKFIAMYGKYYNIAAVVDNNAGQQNKNLEGIKIESPDILQNLDSKKYKVLVCIKNYLSVIRQLQVIGIRDYGIFDPSKSYAKPVEVEKYNLPADTGKVERKPYHIGYVAGVFDMFHIGHVRLLQKAKELCDYLIVGVVSDEDCYRQKHKYPIISCADRVEVLEACRYTDRVEALPTGFGGIRDAHKMFRFDVQFSGDDHGVENGWLAEKEYLNKQGADLVFFDYTKETSSTQIRNRINQEKI